MSVIPSRRSSVAMGLAVSLMLLSSCVLVAPNSPETAASPASSNANQSNNPIIQALTANPTNLTKGQPITVQIRANDPRQQSLDYLWSTTGGTLSTTSGQLVQWNPPTAAGTYTISVLVSNGTGGSTNGSLNLIVDASGNGTLTPTTSFPASASPAPVASSTSPAPDASPAAGASAAPSPVASSAPAHAVNGRTIFADSFEQDFVNWQADSILYSWLIRRNNAQDGTNTALFGNASQYQIEPSAPTYDHKLETRNVLDLTGTRKPTLRFYLNTNTIPASAFVLTVKFGTLTFPVTRTAGETGWTLKEIDLSKAVGEKQKLSFVAKIESAPDKAYDAPMLDNVVLFDAN